MHTVSECGAGMSFENEFLRLTEEGGEAFSRTR